MADSRLMTVFFNKLPYRYAEDPTSPQLILAFILTGHPF